MSKRFEVAGEEWGDTNTILYWVTGYGTTTAKGVFQDKAELMAILEGMVDDFFSTSPRGGSDTPSTVADWEKELKENK